MLRLFGLQIVLAAVSTRSVFGSGDDSCTWEIAKKATWCAGSYSVDKKKLSEEGTGSDECMDLATADPECGDTIYSNDDYCRCILLGKSCDERESSSGTSNVFQCTSPGRCVPEITGLAADDCDDYFSQYECEKYGVSAMSDGICDWEYDPCAGAMCTLEMCPDESMPPIPEDGCCPDVSLCGIKEIPDCEQILCGCPPPSKEIETFDDNGCRSCSCEYAECSEDDTKESLNPCETFYCDSGRWVSAMMACDMCPPNMVSIDDGSCCGSCEETEIPVLCEEIMCGCPPPSKEIETIDDNGCRSCSCEYAECSEDDTKESLNPCETFYCDSGRWVSAMMACGMCPPNMVSIDDGSCCGSCEEIPVLCEEIMCGCPPPSKEIETFDDNGCRSCSCEYAECSEDDTKESLNPCETFYCDSGRWVSAMMACDMCPPNMVSIDDGSCCGSCEEIPDLCEQVLCGCPPPSKEIETFDDNGCRSCSCETEEIPDLCGQVLCDMCPPSMVSIDDGSCCGSCEEACPEVKCLMYCEAGYEQDEYGCDTCTCIEPKPCEGLSKRQTKTCEDCQITLGAELLVEDCGVACASETKTNKIKRCTKKCNKAVNKLKKNDKKAKKKCKKYEM